MASSRWLTLRPKSTSSSKISSARNMSSMSSNVPYTPPSPSSSDTSSSSTWLAATILRSQKACWLSPKPVSSGSFPTNWARYSTNPWTPKTSLLSSIFRSTTRRTTCFFSTYSLNTSRRVRSWSTKKNCRRKSKWTKTSAWRGGSSHSLKTSKTTIWRLESPKMC